VPNRWTLAPSAVDYPSEWSVRGANLPFNCGRPAMAASGEIAGSGARVGIGTGDGPASADGTGLEIRSFVGTGGASGAGRAREGSGLGAEVGSSSNQVAGDPKDNRSEVARVTWPAGVGVGAEEAYPGWAASIGENGVAP
jgi:hypothetical protein